MSIRIPHTQSQVLVVDIQTKLAPHLHDVDNMVTRCVQVLTAAQLFQIPITVAEQYPQGLGNSVEAIAPFIQTPVFEKTSFSCFGCATLSERVRKIEQTGRSVLIIVGCEAHVCVLQTVIDALEQGYRVIVVDNAVASRNPRDALLARERLSQAGAQYFSAEMLLFEWLQNKDHEHFKAISNLLKG